MPPRQHWVAQASRLWARPRRPCYQSGGFAMLLVLILVAMGVILGLSYLSSASLHVAMSHNFQDMAQARYLAESGLEHGLYVLRHHPEQLDGSDITPLGPFRLDQASGDGYTISRVVDADDPNQCVLSATAVVGANRPGAVIQGGIRRTTSAVVYRTPLPIARRDHGMYVSSGLAVLPGTLTVAGNFHINGILLNQAAINGDASATRDVLDSWRRITGSVRQFVDPVDEPEMSVADYGHYVLNGQDCDAVTFRADEVTRDDDVMANGAISPANPGGVVRLAPRDGTTVKLRGNINFTGTLIITGDLELDGNDITLTPVRGFPALVVSGSVRVSNNSRRVVINGLVSADRGIVRGGGATDSSNLTINGALVSQQTGFDSALGGAHRVNYVAERTRVYNFSLPPEQQTPKVSILKWND